MDAAKGLDLVRSDTLLVVVDVNNIKMFESEHIARSVKDVVIIDHHRKTAEFEKEPLITYIEPASSSASELVAEILEQSLPVSSLQQNEANMLYAGIVLDTTDNTYYIFGSHMASAKCDDLLSWEKLSDGYSKSNPVFGQIFDVREADLVEIGLEIETRLAQKQIGKI